MKQKKIILSQMRRRAVGHSLLFSLIIFLIVNFTCCFRFTEQMHAVFFSTLILLPLGFLIGFLNKKIQRWEIRRWRKKLLEAKEWKKKFLCKFSDTGLNEKVLEKIKDNEQKKEWLKSILDIYENLEKEDFQFSLDDYEQLFKFEGELEKLENGQIVNNEFLDNWNELIDKWKNKLKQIKNDIRRCDKRIVICNSILSR
jgi:hypothetical protein